MTSAVKTSLRLGAGDFLLLAAAFLMVHQLKYGRLHFSSTSLTLLGIFCAVWLATSLMTQKYRRLLNGSIQSGLLSLTKSAAVLTFSASFVVVALQLTSTSRTLMYGTCALFYFFQLAVFLLSRAIVRKNGSAEEHLQRDLDKSKSDASLPLMLVDGALVLAAFLLVTRFKQGRLEVTDQYEKVLLVIYSLWLLTGYVTNKFNRRNFDRVYNALAPCFKSFFLMMTGLSVLFFSGRFFYLSRVQVFGALPVLLGFELILFYLYSSYRRHGRHLKDIETAEDVRAFIDRRPASAPVDLQGYCAGAEPVGAGAVHAGSVRDPLPACAAMEPVREKLRNALDFFNPAVFGLIKDHIDLDRVDRSQCVLMSTDNLFNIENLCRAGTRLLINLHKLNDMRWLNRYFLSIHRELEPGGYFVGQAHTIETHRAHFSARYPAPVGKLLYAVDFLWRRASPKLPVTKKVYFALTKGRNRMVSRAEVLGRLYYCGFKVVTERVIENRFYFIAQKVREPSTNRNPTYGPLVKLKRCGLNNQPLSVYKFRTMYPYSEYLQEYIYANNHLEEGGKFKDDFRITAWGRFMRKFWLDELPMIYNWLRGDLKLLGVRPLSEQYLSLYSDRLRELRREVKPGLIPPFYADLPKTLDEIMDSERRYLEAYLQRSLPTQCRYASACFMNIVVRKARSG